MELAYKSPPSLLEYYNELWQEYLDNQDPKDGFGYKILYQYFDVSLGDVTENILEFTNLAEFASWSQDYIQSVMALKIAHVYNLKTK